MTLRIGTVRGLDACASDTGRLSVLALDHRNNLRRMLGPDDPAAVTYEALVEAKRAVVRAIMHDGQRHPARSGAGRRPGHQRTARCPARPGSSWPSRPAATRVRRRPGSAACSRTGAWPRPSAWAPTPSSCCSTTTPTRRTPRSQEDLLIEVAEACADADLPLFLETLGYSIDESSPKLTGEARRDVVVRTARRLTALGGDILKCEFPYDPSVTRPRPLAGGLPGARRGVGHPVGHPLGGRGRRHVRGPDGGGLPGRRLRRAGGALRVGRRRAAAADRARCLAGQRGRGAHAAARGHRRARGPALARALAAGRQAELAEGWYRDYPG